MDLQAQVECKMNNKKNIDEKLSDALEIDIQEETKDIVQGAGADGGHPIIPSTDTVQLNSDYNLVRKNLKEIIDTGNTAIDGILTVASETESPRAYEVAAQMIKNVADVNKDLLEMHNKMKQIQKEDGGNQKASNITNNSLFVGSTQELQRLLKQQKEQMLENELEEQEIIDAEYEAKDE